MKTKNLNNLGKIIVDRKDMTFTKLANHFSISKQGAWAICHKPYKVTSLSLGYVQKIASLLDIPTTELVKFLLSEE